VVAGRARRIAFTRNEDSGESTKFTSDDVYVIDADGGDLIRLTPEQEGRSLGQPAWSPEGRQIAYVNGQSVHSAVPSQYGGLFVMDADGGDPRRLATGRTYKDPDWSPDGREIVVVRGEGLSSATESNDDLYVLDVTSGVARPLTRTPPGVYEAAPAWSPDSSRIAFARTTGGFSDFNGTASIFVMDRDGTGETLVLEHQLFLDAPYSLSWSPDGKTIAFETSSMIGCTSISVVDVESRIVQPLTTCTKPIESTVAPAWQPNAAAEER
jgi:Tol biopolymer transport system component